MPTRRIDLPDDLDDKLKTLARRRGIRDEYMLARIIVEPEIERLYAELLEPEAVREPAA